MSMKESLKKPLPLRLIDNLLERTRFPAILVGCGFAIPMLMLSILSGTIYPNGVEPWSDNPLEMTGLFLMMAILPAYLMMCLVASRRLAICNEHYIANNIADPRMISAVLARWYPWWVLAIPFGIINIYFNVGNGLSLNPGSPAFAVTFNIILGQWLLWTAVGLVLFFALLDAHLLHRMGGLVVINLYDLNALNGFGQNALNNFLMVAGALALTTLQGIDQRFEWVNYRNGLIVGIPAALILVPLPIWTLHQRIRAEKSALLEQIDLKIRSASTSLEVGDLERLNQLLLRREQVQKLRNWPMDLSTFGRFFVYAFIVPLAWAGAALMEVFLDRILGL